MKSVFHLLLFLIIPLSSIPAQQSWIRINQVGYLEDDVKAAVYASKEESVPESFVLVNAETGEQVIEGAPGEPYGAYTAFKQTALLDFSDYTTPGTYYLEAGEAVSPEFRIGNDVYEGAADFILKYMRQQRCGWNPFLQDSCHTHDGFLVDDPAGDSTYVNVTGGWHDAADYLQYLTTSANATYQMLFAWQQNPGAYGDEYDADGNEGANGIPDILDEAKWGLDWLVKMNPSYGVMYNQIADDRDHAGYRLPNRDSVNYGKGLERPVYYITGERQGLAKYKNRTTGVSSSAGKFASAFALGSIVMREYYPEFADMIAAKAPVAYAFGKSDLGVTQTACNKSPYFYEEDNYVDDLELAAAQLAASTGSDEYASEAAYWGAIEPSTPWMGLDTARHYQWYPFVNLGHYLLAAGDQGEVSEQFRALMRRGLEKVWQRGKGNAFLNGVPFIWCSNNLVAALITQAHLYRKATGDTRYLAMEAAMRDWLFGCNPWGTSMIIGYPEDGDYPEDPHSSLWVLEGYQNYGGLVDGPVYGNIFKILRGLQLHEEDEYAQFQSPLVVYHDDSGDYSTNEPTMDGTASLSYYLSAMECEGMAKSVKGKSGIYHQGGLIRSDTTQPVIYLMFSGGDYNDGTSYIADVLTKQGVAAHFFFTGDFYRNGENKEFLQRITEEGHYVGAHSDQHLLYASWENRDSALVTREEFTADLLANYDEMKRFGVTMDDAPYYLPPYEWYNEEISRWTEALGLQLINFSPGTRSNADYTIPSMGDRYVCSEDIHESILGYESTAANGLNGFHLFLHVGTHPEREDKFYYRLDELLTELKHRGYTFRLLTQ